MNPIPVIITSKTGIAVHRILLLRNKFFFDRGREEAIVDESGIGSVCLEIVIWTEQLGHVVSKPSHSSSASNLALHAGHLKWNDIFGSPVVVWVWHEKRHIPKECPSLRLPQRLKVHTIRMCQILTHWLQKHFEVNVYRSGSSEMDVIHQLYNFISSIVRSFLPHFLLYGSWYSIYLCRVKSQPYQQKNQADWAWLYCVVGVEVFGIHSW